MLDELFPVHFVEGLNEGAEQFYEDTMVITRYSGTGIQYTPQVSYVMTKLEIMMTFGDLPPKARIGVNLCWDYDEKPSDIILSSGDFVPKTAHGGWCEVTLKPISVIKGRKYWVTIHPNGCPTALIRAEKGRDCLLSVRTERKWEAPPEEVRYCKVMLRFYGRILPFSSY